MEKEPEEIIICGKDWYRKTLLIGAIAIIAITAILIATGYFLDSRKQEQTTAIPEPEIKIVKEFEVVEVVKEVEVSELEWSIFTVTAYTQQDLGCDNYTAIGLNLDKAWVDYFNLVAVDPDIIPYGKTVFIKTDSGIIEALAVDTGGRIVGKRLDLYMETLEEAYSWGVQELEVGVVR